MVRLLVRGGLIAPPAEFILALQSISQSEERVNGCGYGGCGYESAAVGAVGAAAAAPVK